MDMDWQGRPRKLLLHPGRNGFMLVLDRATGELLSAQKFVDSTNWASGFDLKTGSAMKILSKRTHQGKTTGIFALRPPAARNSCLPRSLRAPASSTFRRITLAWIMEAKRPATSRELRTWARGQDETGARRISGITGRVGCEEREAGVDHQGTARFLYTAAC